jgi:hypothetical protein
MTNAPLAAQKEQNQTAPAGESVRGAQGEQEASASKLTFDGEAALLTVAIRPDKTADFDRILSRLQAALMKSSDPQRQKQAEGWKVIKLTTPLPDGNVAYVHIIDPVVPGAGYGVMQILYDAFPDERQQLYESYRDAFVRNVALAVGSVAVDMNQTASSTSPPSSPGEGPAQPAPASPQPAVPSSAPPDNAIPPR